ncbi:MAG TPA: hypothetical protein VGS79_22625 [Puia sp.]|nr:hypothetical protein [Puia sp.]
MKKLFFPLLSLLFLAACETPMQVSENRNDSYLMHVECVPGSTTRNEILLLMKRGHAKDIKVDEGGSSMTIEAAYYKADIDIGLLQSIADDLRLIGTVVDVEILDNPNVVKQPR